MKSRILFLPVLLFFLSISFISCQGKGVSTEETNAALALQETGMSSYNAWNLTEAIESFEASAKIVPLGKTYYYIGKSYMGMEEYKKAIKNFKKSMSLEFWPRYSRYNAACAASLMGDAETAYEFLTEDVYLGWDDFDKFSNDVDLQNFRDSEYFSLLMQSVDQYISQLAASIRLGSLSSISNIMDQGITPDLVLSSAEMSPLQYAASLGQVDALETLLFYGADADFTNSSEPLSALQIAVKENENECVVSLLDHGASFHEDAGDDAEIFLAMNLGEQTVFNTLIAEGADLNIENSSGLSPLANAILNGKDDFCKGIIKGGADLKGNTSFGMPPLHLACALLDEDMISLLLENGAGVKQADDFGRTPLHTVVLSSEFAKRNPARVIDCAELLIEEGANINATDDYEKTPYFYAGHIYTGNLDNTTLTSAAMDLLFFLEDQGADTSQGYDAALNEELRFAYLENDLEKAETALGEGAYVNLAENGELLIQKIVEDGKTNFLDLFVENNVILYDTNHSFSAVYSAVEKENIELLETVLEAGAKFDEWGDYGALFRAVKNKDSQSVQLLLEYGADPNTENSSGDSILKKAVYYGDLDCVAALVDAGADFEVPVKVSAGSTQLLNFYEYAIRRSEFEIAKYFGELGIEYLSFGDEGEE